MWGGVAGDERFEYRSLHLGHGVCKGRTVEDVHRTFLLWSQKPADREADSFNVSKAFRRLTAFADYTTSMFDKYFTSPVDMEAADIVAASELMEILVPRETDAKTGAVVWIMDMGGWDLRKFADLEALGTSHEAIMRWFFAFMVTSMWDEATAIHGAIIVEAFGDMGFRGMMKMQGLFKPIEDDLNKMFYGVMPFKMKAVVLVGCPWWLSALIAFMRLFISKKMSARIKNLSDEDTVKELGGPDALPVGFLSGTCAYESRCPGFAKRLTSGGAGGDKREDDDDDDEDDEVEDIEL